jgi:hypothetical protein
MLSREGRCVREITAENRLSAWTCETSLSAQLPTDVPTQLHKLYDVIFPLKVGRVVT